MRLVNLTSLLLLFLLGVKVAIFVPISSRHYRATKRTGYNRFLNEQPFVSILVPCYNEELVLSNCIRSLVDQSYRNFEIIIINDGSNDGTKTVAKRLKKKYPCKVKFFTKPNGGKASALNYGLLKSSGEIVVSIDADSVFQKDTLRRLILPFDDPTVSGVGGNIKVANRQKILNRHQAIEYINGLNLERRAFSQLNCLQVIPGSIGAFRRSALQKAGGYSSDTIVEDMDLTVTISRQGGKVVYNSQAIAYTEAPESMNDFISQRYRWAFGGLQVLRKHKEIILNRRFRTPGMVGLPYFMISPWIDVLVTVVFILNILRAVIYGNYLEGILYYLCMSSVQALLMMYSLILDHEDTKLMLLAAVIGLWYNHVISLILVSAGINFLMGNQTAWLKITRLGKNYRPQLSG